MHRRSPPVIHGDLHPVCLRIPDCPIMDIDMISCYQGNVLVTAAGEALLCDFGLSRIHHDVTRTATNILEGGHRHYIAPELTSSASETFRTTKSSDIYSLGMTFYSLVTLEIPFGNLPGYDAMHQIKNGHRPGHPTVTNLSADLRIEATVWSLIEEMWVHTPDTRPTATDTLRRVRSAEDSLRVRRYV